MLRGLQQLSRFRGAATAAASAQQRRRRSAASTTTTALPTTTAAAAAPLNMADEQLQNAGHDHWFKAWSSGDTGWDAGKPAPQLAALLASRAVDAAGKRVLVPGCGRGYDVFAFAAAGAARAVGLDICPEAVEAAAEERDRQLAGAPDVAARCELVVGDFFGGDANAADQEQQQQQVQQPQPSGWDAEPFDVGYDYTFLCALHPTMRRDWAAAWARRLAPGGELVTLCFPVGEPASPAARRDPPWQVTPELYRQLLLPAGFEELELRPVPGELSHAGRAGREWLGRWRRRRERQQEGADGSDGALGEEEAAAARPNL